MNNKYVNEMVLDVLTEAKSYEDMDVKDYRGTIQIVCKTLRAFLEAAEAIQDRGWTPSNNSNAQQLRFGVEFDCEPKVAVVISLFDVNHWVKRYVNDAQTPAPVPELAQAANALVSDTTVPMISTVHSMLATEAAWMARKNR